jgi:hypothetical protein
MFCSSTGAVMFLKSISLAVLLMAGAAPSMAQDAATKPLSFKECGAKYRSAKADGSLGARKWLDYRRAECGITADAFRQPPSRSEASRAEATRRLAFPVALASEFSSQKPWEARMRTCLKSYREQKKAGTLYGVKWVERGGGYYSLCSAKLREATKV